MSSGQKMDVEMRNAFPCIRPVIDNHPEPRLIDFQLGSNLLSDQKQMPQKALIPHPGLSDSGNNLFRNDQHMKGRLRSNIVKGNDPIIFVNNVGRNLALDDLGENGLAHDVLISLSVLN